MGSGAIFVITVLISLVVIGVGAWIASALESAKLAKMAPEEREAYLEEKSRRAVASELATRNLQHGQVNPQMICPHCQSRGKVRAKHVALKRGVSGGKAAAAVLTGGVSVLATGLSRKEGATEAHCDNCGSTWHF
jgi:hypothetical protein